MLTAIVDFCSLVFILVLKNSNLNDIAENLQNENGELGGKAADLLAKTVFIIRDIDVNDKVE